MRIDTQNTGARDTSASTQLDSAVSKSVSVHDASGRQQTAQQVVRLPEKEAANGPVSAGELNAAVSNINDYVQQIQRTLEFSVDDDTGTTVVKVLDSSTDEVIRQFPPEEALALARHLQATSETQTLDSSGLMLHARA